MGSSILKITGTSLRSILGSLNSCRGARMVSTVNNSDESHSSSSSSPWLMLSPRSHDTAYNLYSFAESRVLGITKSDLKYEDESGFRNATRIVGSSQGWLACFNHLRNCNRGELFLSNPLSGRRVNLPPIHNLPIPESNLSSDKGCIEKIIISCSDPESEECRTMMSFGTVNRFAFCCPGRISSTEWTIIGSQQTRSYEDFVYCGTHQLFFSVKQNSELEAWDLRDPLSPRLVWSRGAHELEVGRDSGGKIKQELTPAQENEPRDERWDNRWMSMKRKYLVVSQQGELFLVHRYINSSMLPDGSFAPMDSVQDLVESRKYPSKTIDFDVHKIVREGDGGKMVEMDGHLDGLVMFIGGLSHGTAMPAADADGFQPNSICFTDGASGPSSSVHGTDNGIFNYEKKTFSSCYYPSDYQSLKNKIVPQPLWFTPSPPIKQNRLTSKSLA